MADRKKEDRNTKKPQGNPDHPPNMMYAVPGTYEDHKNARIPHDEMECIREMFAKNKK